MFIKLTRFDNRPVWLNAGFVVTVEPRRDGVGSVVVPIGDGLDYDVRESPEEVLRLIDGAPAPSVVPVPVSDSLTKTPAEGATAEPSCAEPPVAAPPKPRKRATRGRAKPPAAAKESGDRPAAAPAAEAAAEPAPAEKTEPQPAPPPAELELSEADVQRLRKLAPKTLGKLKNTLMTQFRLADVGANVVSLAARGVFALDGSKVLWPAEA